MNKLSQDTFSLGVIEPNLIRLQNKKYTLLRHQVLQVRTL